jgi:hypothetical protein
VATVDGSAFWIAGGAGGISYLTYGATSVAQVLSTPASNRVVQIFADQLVATSGSGTYVNVFSVGTGMPSCSIYLT